MVALDDIARAFNISGLEVELAFDGPPDEDLPTHGRVVLTATRGVVQVVGLTLEYLGVREEPQENGSTEEHFTNLDTLARPLSLPVAPGSPQVIPFVRDFATGYAFNKYYHRLELRATADVPNSGNPVAVSGMGFRPIPPIQQLRDALESKLHMQTSVGKRGTPAGPCYTLDLHGIPARMRDTIDTLSLDVYVTDIAHAQPLVSASHPREAAPVTTLFRRRDGRPCALAIESRVDRDGAGLSGLKKEIFGEDKATDRHVAADVESAVARIAGFLEYVHTLGPVR
jgi:hypothetical protein